MGLPPTGEIVARPMVCQSVRLRARVPALQSGPLSVATPRQVPGEPVSGMRCQIGRGAQKEALPPKGKRSKALPPGTQITLTLQPNETWTGTLTAGGVTVKSSGPVGAGSQAVVVSLRDYGLSPKPRSPQ